MTNFRSVAQILAESKLKKKIDNELMDRGTCPACHSKKTRYFALEATFYCEGCGFTASE